MKKKKKWFKWVVLLVIIVLAAVWYFFIRKETKAASYREMQVTQGELTTWYNFDGLVRARRQQTLTTQSAGKVKSVYVSQNQKVREGDRICKLENGETVRADIDGEVTLLSVEAGDVVSAGNVLAEIIDTDRLELTLNVDEYDVGAVTPGVEVNASILATEQTVNGRVRALDKNGTASGDLSYYTAYVTLDAAEGVYPGMQVSAKVLRSHVENGAIVSMDAIQFDEYNRPYVLVPREGESEPAQVTVTVGASDGVNCEIISGVTAGTTVLVPSNLSMAELMQQMRNASRGK